MNLLGVAEPVSTSEMEPGNFSERGLKITGEFLRRHHHRLGHEIIALGMPSGNKRVERFKEDPTI